MNKIVKKVALCIPQIKQIVSERDTLKRENVLLKLTIRLLEEKANPQNKVGNHDYWNQSRQRWINDKPAMGLTWGVQIKGDKFIEKVISHYSLAGKSILEIGPGYGRLLESTLRLKGDFKKYTAVDISRENINYLNRTFKDPRISFVHGDFEQIGINEKFDVVLSSLTFKHLYPSFEKLLINVHQHLNNDGWVFFDLIEDTPRSFFESEETFVRHYSKPEVSEILSRTSLLLDSFDTVKHDKNHTRLLVVARNK